MKYNVFYTTRTDPYGELTPFRQGVDRKTMLSNRRYLVKSRVTPRIFIGEVEIEVTDDDK